MSKESLEHLSSLMDGELSRETGLFLTRRLSADATMCETWERYHLIRDCIRQPGSKQLVSGLSAKFNASVGVEGTPAVSGLRFGRWLKPVSGLAIAASVALVAISVTAPQPGELPATDGDLMSRTVNQPFVSPNTLPLAPVSQPASFAPGQQTSSNRLSAYLLRHNQMARTAGRQGFVSFVPIVATPAYSLTDESEEKPETAPTETGKDVAESK